MMYYELWLVLWNWKRAFTAKEFAAVFASPDPNKVLHDMTKKGLLERAGWGNYKVKSPKEYLFKKVNISKAYEVIKGGAYKYSLTGPDAVYFWTKGGYQVDRFFGFYPIHLKILSSQVKEWKEFLGSRNQTVHIEGQAIKETLFGVFYILYPENKITSEEIEGFEVDPLAETVQFCFDRIYSYEPALEMLNEMYDLNLEIEYRETRTNL